MFNVPLIVFTSLRRTPLLLMCEDTALGGGKTTQGQQIELRFSLFCGLCFVKKKQLNEFLSYYSQLPRDVSSLQSQILLCWPRQPTPDPKVSCEDGIQGHLSLQDTFHCHIGLNRGHGSGQQQWQNISFDTGQPEMKHLCARGN